MREGMDFGLSGKLDKLKWSASYSYVRATYDTDVEFVNAGNSSSDVDGIYTARKGDRMPSIPKHQLKLRAQYAVTPEWSVGSNLIAYSLSLIHI